MRCTCRRSTSGSRRSPRGRNVQQLVVRDAAPRGRTESRAASSRSLTGCMVPGLVSTGSRSTRNRNSGSTRMLSRARWIPASKPPARRPAAKEAEQGAKVGLRHPTPEGSARDSPENLPRTRFFLGSRPGAAHEQPLPARRFTGSGGVERTGDAHLIDRRLRRLRRRAPALGNGQHFAGRPRLQHPVALRPALDERDAEHPRSPPARRGAPRGPRPRAACTPPHVRSPSTAPANVRGGGVPGAPPMSNTAKRSPSSRTSSCCRFWRPRT